MPGVCVRIRFSGLCQKTQNSNRKPNRNIFSHKIDWRWQPWLTDVRVAATTQAPARHHPQAESNLAIALGNRWQLEVWSSHTHSTLGELGGGADLSLLAEAAAQTDLDPKAGHSDRGLEARWALCCLEPSQGLWPRGQGSMDPVDPTFAATLGVPSRWLCSQTRVQKVHLVSFNLQNKTLRLPAQYIHALLS